MENNTDAKKHGIQKLVSLVSSYFEKFLRQELKACLSPIPKLFLTVLFFFLLTVVTIPLGAAIFWQTLLNVEATIRYDNFNPETGILTNLERKQRILNDNFNRTVSLKFDISEEMEGPVNQNIHFQTHTITFSILFGSNVFWILGLCLL